MTLEAAARLLNLSAPEAQQLLERHGIVYHPKTVRRHKFLGAFWTSVKEGYDERAVRELARLIQRKKAV